MTDLLLWRDLETTGSSETDGDEIIEIGCILTTENLTVLGENSWLVLPGPLALGRLMQNDVVRTMHQANGLLDGILNTPHIDRPHLVTREVLYWLESLGVDIGRRGLILAGSGVGHFDKRFIDKYMPQLSQILRYSVIDIGVIRRAHRMWVGTEVSAENDSKTHRALDDIRCHLAEAKAYRQLWRGPEGPRETW
jgi:oligoribonuclease